MDLFPHLFREAVGVEVAGEHREARAVDEGASPEVQPLVEEGEDRRLCARVLVEPVHLRAVARLRVELPGLRRSEELVVRRLAPEVVAEPARELVGGQLEAAVGARLAPRLEVIEELGRHQRREDHGVDPLEPLEVAGRVEGRVQLLHGHLAPESVAEEGLREGLEAAVIDGSGGAGPHHRDAGGVFVGHPLGRPRRPPRSRRRCATGRPGGRRGRRLPPPPSRRRGRRRGSRRRPGLRPRRRGPGAWPRTPRARGRASGAGGGALSPRQTTGGSSPIGRLGVLPPRVPVHPRSARESPDASVSRSLPCAISRDLRPVRRTSHAFSGQGECKRLTGCSRPALACG